MITESVVDHRWAGATQWKAWVGPKSVNEAGGLPAVEPHRSPEGSVSGRQRASRHLQFSAPPEGFLGLVPWHTRSPRIVRG